MFLDWRFSFVGIVECDAVVTVLNFSLFSSVNKSKLAKTLLISAVVNILAANIYIFLLYIRFLYFMIPS
ncbi:hypothetical protein EH5_01175 [Bacillus subtilis]|nr:hypothetical protein EH5_01175 [Bacillus subtilis]